MDQLKPVESVLDFLDEAYGALSNELVERPFGFDERQEVYTCLLYARILELTEAFTILWRSSHAPAAAVILRTILEVYVDLKNVTAEADYWKNLQLDNLVQFRKILLEAKGGGNQYLTSLTALPELARGLSEYDFDIQYLRGEGAKQFTKKMKFLHADMAAEYDSVYNSLSAESHGDARSLQAWHSRVDENGVPSFFLKVESPGHQAASHPLLAASLLLSSVELVGNVVPTANKELCGGLIKQWHKIEEKWLSA